MIDKDVITAFRGKALSSGRGYQTLINEALRAALAAGRLAKRPR
jgi:uncharacterized protein (DUF4415 family)